jgi:uncharacterized membrane protein YoaK (UPF0700 family)
VPRLHLVYTTYLTGNLSKFAEALTEYFFWLRDRTKGRFTTRIGKVPRITARQESAQLALLTAGLFLAFLCGAIGGVAGDDSWGTLALVIPAAILGVIVVIDICCHVALGDVKRGLTPYNRTT